MFICFLKEPTLPNQTNMHGTFSNHKFIVVPSSKAKWKVSHDIEGTDAD